MCNFILFIFNDVTMPFKRVKFKSVVFIAYLYYVFVSNIKVYLKKSVFSFSKKLKRR